jgi:ubiquinone/menaquinone biosynthesis C-methylase UbiE
MQVLEIGCGTGSFTLELARVGAHVEAVDLSQDMLAEAKRKASAEQGIGQIQFHCMDAAVLDSRFDPKSFDLIVSSLAMSEMGLTLQARVLEMCFDLCKPGGRLVILDEAQPDAAFKRIALKLLRAPLRALTWLLTRTTTHPLKKFESTVHTAGWAIEGETSVLGGALKVWVARRSDTLDQDTVRDEPPQIKLKSRWVTFWIDLWALFFRIIPPYPKVEPGFYRIGSPTRQSPVLVTGNFEITVRRLVNVIAGDIDSWLLVVDSAGINVWCAAGGGFLTAEKIVGALAAHRVETYVDRHAMVLPQLCANGVNGWKLREETGWGVHWGPVHVRDLPTYLNGGRKKTDSMRWVRFPLRDRLEMMAVTLGFYGLLILIPVAIFWPHQLLAVAVGLLGLSTFYAVAHPWLPGRDGMQKSIPLAGIALLGMVGYSAWMDPVPASDLFNRVIGVSGLSVFVAGEMQGMSPHMRGEQANWITEGIVGATLLAIYYLVPKILGWS